MPDSPLTRLVGAARSRVFGRRATAPPDGGRRQFMRRAGATLSIAAMLSDEAWAASEARAAAFDITPGTVVDRHGRPAGADHRDQDIFVGEIMLVGYNFATRGFAFCNGQLLAIASNTALFSLLGTTYGGDGRTTFGLPDLRGRFPMQFGNGPGLTPRTLGQKFGSEAIPLTVQNLPSHTHQPDAQTGQGTSRSPTGNVIAGTPGVATYAAAPGDTQMAPTEPTGGGVPVNHMPPTLALNFQIALFGTYPSRS